MTTNVYLLTAKSNLHVGAGSSNYGVIDNLIQRDVTDGFPNIFSSSLKGAFREWFESKQSKSAGDDVFGSSDKGKSTVSFSDAHLLALPVRSNLKPFFMATCPYLLRKFKVIVTEDFGIDANTIKILEEIDLLLKSNTSFPKVIGQRIDNLKIESLDNIGNEIVNIPTIKDILGENIVIFSDEDMRNQCSDYSLPVIARNCLENGQSTNLWYEQIIPRQSCFYFVIEGVEKSEKLLNAIVTTELIQIGANATIGYGRCSIKKINKKDNEICR